MVRDRASLSVEEIREALKAAPGVTVVDDPQNYVYPMPLESAGHDDIYVAVSVRILPMTMAIHSGSLATKSVRVLH